MRSRPRPDPRRGLLRAGIVVVLLVALLVVAMLIVSSLLAPKAQAPTAPITPGPIGTGTPSLIRTPGTPVTTARPLTPAPTAKASAHATPAPTRVKKLSLGPPGPLAEHLPSDVLRKLTAIRASSTTAAPRWAAVFVGEGDAYRGRGIDVHDRATGATLRVPVAADPYIAPVWAPNQRSLYFVTVRQAPGIPGAAWTLHRWDRTTGRVVSLTTARALGLFPLGDVGGRFLYALSRAEDTVVNAVAAGRTSFVTTLISQPISSAFLAPGGTSIAFAAPSSCAFCTVDVYDLIKLWIWYGPSGAPSDLDVAWAADGSWLATFKGHNLVTMTREATLEARFSVPGGLPRRWTDPMRASISGNRLRLTDLVSGRSFVAKPLGSA